ncbi:MAG: DUF177 domain-containing protein [Chitinispirillaceae bacterium]|nr:DUF177 domain-containing protein [Chitinispirillaceae bacterium]
MILDTGSIREGHSVIRQAADLASVKNELPPFGGTIDCEATIDRNGSMLYVQLRFDGAFEQVCARCLEKFAYPVGETLTLVLQEEEGRSGRAGDDESADFYFNTGHQSVDLSSVIYDEVMTSLPLKPLCSETCKGVIPADGFEKQTVEQEYDPRWEALLKLKKNK